MGGIIFLILVLQNAGWDVWNIVCVCGRGVINFLGGYRLGRVGGLGNKKPANRLVLVGVDRFRQSEDRIHNLPDHAGLINKPEHPNEFWSMRQPERLRHCMSGFHIGDGIHRNPE